MGFRRKINLGSLTISRMLLWNCTENKLLNTSWQKWAHSGLMWYCFLLNTTANVEWVFTCLPNIIRTKVHNSDELKQQQIEVLCAAKQHVIDAAIHNIHQWFTSDTKLHLNACVSKADILNKVCHTFKRLKLHFTYFVRRPWPICISPRLRLTRNVMMTKIRICRKGW